MPTFASIDCRLEALIATVNALGDIRPVKATLLGRLNRAKTQKERAEQLVSQYRRRRAQTSLERASQSMMAFRAGIEPGSIPPATRAALVASAKSIRHDLRLLRRTLASTS